MEDQESIINAGAQNDYEGSGTKPPQWLIDILLWAAKDPWEFVITLLIILAPFFLISAFLAYKLSKMIEAKEEVEKKTAKRMEKIKKKLKRTKAD